MKPDFTKSLLFVICGIFYAFGGNAASSLFSNYGQIQNVQNYSSNPFWTPNSPYNSSVPRPVYVQGTDLDTEECTNVVKSLVAVQCMVRDNCKNTPLSEIRPEIMVQLSKLPNHNYVTACAGFIDGAYNDYVEQYGNTISARPVAFPTGTTPTQTNNNIQIENPYKQKDSKYQAEVKERANELAALQRQNGGNNAKLTASAFPTTYADYSFSERVENEFAGLEPYKDLKSYRELNVKTSAEWCADTEHKQSPECMKFLCSEGGAEATTFECITWRCSQSEYEKANHEMCEMNKYCGKNDASNECLRYKCNLDGYKELNQCKIWLCDNDPIYESEHHDECEKILNAHKPGGGNGSGEGSGATPSKNDCTNQKKQEDPHVTKAELNANNECIIKECESSWHPNTADNKCEEDNSYYVLLVYTITFGITLSDKDTKCYSSCGSSYSGGDDVNEKVLRPLFGKAYCSPTKIGQTTMREENGNELRFTKDQKDKIATGLRSIADKGNCDWGLFRIYAEIQRFDKETGKYTLVDTITLDG